MKHIHIAILTIITVIFTSCSPFIEGNGNVIKREYDLGSFKNIKISGEFDAVIKQGNKTQLTIETDENLIEYIEVYVEGNQLVVEPTERLRKAKAMNLYITSKEISKIDLQGAVALRSKSKLKSKFLCIDGSGAVEIDLQIDSKNLDIDISGASEIELAGNCDNLRIDISGAGEVEAYELETKEAAIDISGAGSAKVNVKEVLEVDITGAGAVKYQGNPEIDKHITGAGSIEKK